MVLDVPALSHGAVDRADYFSCSLTGTVGSLFTPGYLEIQAGLSRFYSDGAVLELVWRLVPYTLALSAALSAGGVSSGGALQCTPGRPVTSPASFQRVALLPRISSALLPEPPNYQKHINTTISKSMPSLTRNLRLIFPLVLWKVSERDGSYTGDVVLCWGLVEQARHEQMSDEYVIVVVIPFVEIGLKPGDQ